MVSASTTPKSEGLSAAQIRALFALREEKLEDVGMAIEVDPKRIPETIDRKRPNENIRQKLCAYLNLPYEKLWGAKPAEQNSDGDEVVAA